MEPQYSTSSNVDGSKSVTPSDLISSIFSRQFGGTLALCLEELKDCDTEESLREALHGSQRCHELSAILHQAMGSLVSHANQQQRVSGEFVSPISLMVFSPSQTGETPQMGLSSSRGEDVWGSSEATDEHIAATWLEATSASLRQACLSINAIIGQLLMVTREVKALVTQKFQSIKDSGGSQRKEVALLDLLCLRSSIIALTHHETWWMDDFFTLHNTHVYSETDEHLLRVMLSLKQPNAAPVFALKRDSISLLEDYVSYIIFQVTESAIPSGLKKVLQTFAIELFSVVARVDSSSSQGEEGSADSTFSSSSLTVKYIEAYHRIIKDLPVVKNYYTFTKYTHLLSSVPIAGRSIAEVELLCRIAADLGAVTKGRKDVKKLLADFVVRVFEPLCYEGFAPQGSIIHRFSQHLYMSYLKEWLEKDKYHSFVVPLASVCLCLGSPAFFSAEFVAFFVQNLKCIIDGDKKFRVAYLSSLLHCLGFYLNWAAGQVRELEPITLASPGRGAAVQRRSTSSTEETTAQSFLSLNSLLKNGITVVPPLAQEMQFGEHFNKAEFQAAQAQAKKEYRGLLHALADGLMLQCKKSSLSLANYSYISLVADVIVMTCRTKIEDGAQLLVDMLPLEAGHVSTDATLAALVALTALDEIAFDCGNVEAVPLLQGTIFRMPFWNFGPPTGSGGHMPLESFARVYSPFSSFRASRLDDILLGSDAEGTSDVLIDIKRLNTVRSLCRSDLRHALRKHFRSIARALHLVLSTLEKDVLASQHLRSSKSQSSTIHVYLSSLSEKDRSLHSLFLHALIASRHWYAEPYVFHLLPKCVLHYNRQLSENLQKYILPHFLLHSSCTVRRAAVYYKLFEFALVNLEEKEVVTSVSSVIEIWLRASADQIKRFSQTYKSHQSTVSGVMLLQHIRSIDATFFNPLPLHQVFQGGQMSGHQFSSSRQSNPPVNPPVGYFSIIDSNPGSCLADLLEAFALILIGMPSSTLRLLGANILHSIDVIQHSLQDISSSEVKAVVSGPGTSHPSTPEKVPPQGQARRHTDLSDATTSTVPPSTVPNISVEGPVQQQRISVAHIMDTAGSVLAEEATEAVYRNCATGCHWSDTKDKSFRAIGACFFGVYNEKNPTMSSSGGSLFEELRVGLKVECTVERQWFSIGPISDRALRPPSRAGGWTKFINTLVGTKFPLILAVELYKAVIQHGHPILRRVVAQLGFLLALPHAVGMVPTLSIYLKAENPHEEYLSWEVWKAKFCVAFIFNGLINPLTTGRYPTMPPVGSPVPKPAVSRSSSVPPSSGASIASFVTAGSATSTNPSLALLDDSAKRLQELLNFTLSSLTKFSGIQDFFDTVSLLFVQTKGLYQSTSISYIPEMPSLVVEILKKGIDEVLKPMLKKEKRRAIVVSQFMLDLLLCACSEMCHRVGVRRSHTGSSVRSSTGMDGTTSLTRVRLFEYVDYLIAAVITGSGVSSASLTMSSVAVSGQHRPAAVDVAMGRGLSPNPGSILPTMPSVGSESIADPSDQWQNVNNYEHSYAIRLRLVICDVFRCFATAGSECIAFYHERINVWISFLISNIMPFVKYIRSSRPTMQVNSRQSNAMLSWYASAGYFLHRVLSTLHAVLQVPINQPGFGLEGRCDYQQAILALFDQVVDQMDSRRSLSTAPQGNNANVLPGIVKTGNVGSTDQFLYRSSVFPNVTLTNIVVDILVIHGKHFLHAFMQKLATAMYGTCESVFYFEACALAILQKPIILNLQEAEEIDTSTVMGGKGTNSPPSSAVRSNRTLPIKSGEPTALQPLMLSDFAPLLTYHALCHIVTGTMLKETSQRLLNLLFVPMKGYQESRDNSPMSGGVKGGAISHEVEFWTDVIIGHSTLLRKNNFFYHLCEITAHQVQLSSSSLVLATIVQIVAMFSSQYDLVPEVLEYLLWVTRRFHHEHPLYLKSLWNGFNENTIDSIQRLCRALTFSFTLEDQQVVLPFFLSSLSSSKHSLVCKALFVAALSNLREMRTLHMYPSLASSVSRNPSQAQSHSFQRGASSSFSRQSPANEDADDDASMYIAFMNLRYLSSDASSCISWLFQSSGEYGTPTTMDSSQGQFNVITEDSQQEYSYVSANLCAEMAKCTSILSKLAPFFLVGDSTSSGEHFCKLLCYLFHAEKKEQAPSKSPMERRDTSAPNAELDEGLDSDVDIDDLEISQPALVTAKPHADDDSSGTVQIHSEISSSVEKPQYQTAPSFSAMQMQTSVLRRDFTVLLLHGATMNLAFWFSLQLSSSSSATKNQYRVLMECAVDVFLSVLCHPSVFMRSFSGAEAATKEADYVTLKNHVTFHLEALRRETTGTGQHGWVDEVGRVVGLLGSVFPLTMCSSWFHELLKWANPALPLATQSSPEDILLLEENGAPFLLCLRIFPGLLKTVVGGYYEECLNVLTTHTSSLSKEVPAFVTADLHRFLLSLQVLTTPALGSFLRSITRCYRYSRGLVSSSQKGGIHQAATINFMKAFHTALSENTSLLLITNSIGLQLQNSHVFSSLVQQNPFALSVFSENELCAYFWASFALIMTSEFHVGGIEMMSYFYQSRCHLYFVDGMRRVPQTVFTHCETELSEKLSIIGVEKCALLISLMKCSSSWAEGSPEVSALRQFSLPATERQPSERFVALLCDYCLRSIEVESSLAPYIAATFATLMASDRHGLETAIRVVSNAKENRQAPQTEGMEGVISDVSNNNANDGVGSKNVAHFNLMLDYLELVDSPSNEAVGVLAHRMLQDGGVDHPQFAEMEESLHWAGLPLIVFNVLLACLKLKGGPERCKMDILTFLAELAVIARTNLILCQCFLVFQADIADGIHAALKQLTDVGEPSRHTNAPHFTNQVFNVVSSTLNDLNYLKAEFVSGSAVVSDETQGGNVISLLLYLHDNDTLAELVLRTISSDAPDETSSSWKAGGATTTSTSMNADFVHVIGNSGYRDLCCREGTNEVLYGSSENRSPSPNKNMNRHSKEETQKWSEIKTAYIPPSPVNLVRKNSVTDGLQEVSDVQTTITPDHFPTGGSNSTTASISIPLYTTQDFTGSFGSFKLSHTHSSNVPVVKPLTMRGSPRDECQSLPDLPVMFPYMYVEDQGGYRHFVDVHEGAAVPSTTNVLLTHSGNNSARQQASNSNQTSARGPAPEKKRATVLLHAASSYDNLALYGISPKDGVEPPLEPMYPPPSRTKKKAASSASSSSSGSTDSSSSSTSATASDSYNE